MKKQLQYFLAGAIAMIIVITLFFLNGIFHMGESEPITITTIDTVYIKKPYKPVEVKPKEQARPARVKAYINPDTTLRAAIEKDTLISSVQITNRIAKIHKITPKGIAFINEYPIRLPEIKEIEIDPQGNVKIKKKKRRKLKKALRIAGAVGIFVGGIIVGGKIAPSNK